MFKQLNKIYPNILKLPLMERFKKVSALINQVHINNPHYKIPKYILYNTVKEKALKFANDLNFQCLRCANSCCYFSKDETLIKEIGIYSEDISLLKDNDQDLKGFELTYRDDIFNFVNSTFFNNLLTKNIFLKIQAQFVRLLGYETNLKIIFKKGRYQCYYFNEKKNECKINEYKPLVCYTYPFRIQNNLERAGIMTATDCTFVKNNLLYGKNYEEKIFDFKSFFEYYASVILFLEKKERVELVDGVYHHTLKNLKKLKI